MVYIESFNAIFHAAAIPIVLDGIVHWAYHVAAIAQFNHQVYVLDPALDPSVPLPLEAWFKVLSSIKRGITAMPPTTPEGGKAHPGASESTRFKYCNL